MSLKTRVAKRAAGWRMLRVNEHRHAEFGAIEFGRNEGVRGGEPAGPLVDGDARGGLKLGRCANRALPCEWTFTTVARTNRDSSLSNI
jgi:hypothetical protein